MKKNNTGNIFKCYFQSDSKVSGTNSNANFIIKMNHIITNGYCYVSSLCLATTDNTILTLARKEIHVKTASLHTDRIWQSNNTNCAILGVIPINNESILNTTINGGSVCPTQIRYVAPIVSEHNGFPLQVLNLSNLSFNIKFTDELGNALNPAKIDSWSMCITFVLFSDSNEKMILPPPKANKGPVRKIGKDKTLGFKVK